MKIHHSISTFIIVLLSMMPFALFSQTLPDAEAKGNSTTAPKLTDQEADPNAPDANGATPLMTACRWGNIPLVQGLLNKGVKPDTPRSPRGRTTLMVTCAYYGGVAVCQLLVDHGADVNARADDGSTPLMLAAGSAKITVVEYLLAKGADPNATDKQGNTALDYARTADMSLLGTSAIPDTPFDKEQVIERLKSVMTQ